MAFVVIRLIYVNFRVCRKKKRCRGSNGVGYYPLLVLCRDTAVVSRYEGRGAHGKRTCAHYQGPARVRQRILCRDRVGSPCVATGVSSVTIRRWAVRAFGVAT